ISGSVRLVTVALAEWSPALNFCVACLSDLIGLKVSLSRTMVRPADRLSAARTRSAWVIGVNVPLKTRRWVSQVPIKAPPRTTTRLTLSRRQNSGTVAHRVIFCFARLSAWLVVGAKSAWVTSGTRRSPTASAGWRRPRSWRPGAVVPFPTSAAAPPGTADRLRRVVPRVARWTALAGGPPAPWCRRRFPAGAAGSIAGAAPASGALLPRPADAADGDAEHRNVGSRSGEAGPLHSRTA